MHSNKLSFRHSIAAKTDKRGSCIKSLWSKPGIFTNVGAHIEFIKDVMANERQNRMAIERETRSNAMSYQFLDKLMITAIFSMKIYNIL